MCLFVGHENSDPDQNSAAYEHMGGSRGGGGGGGGGGGAGGPLSKLDPLSGETFWIRAWNRVATVCLQNHGLSKFK